MKIYFTLILLVFTLATTANSLKVEVICSKDLKKISVKDLCHKETCQWKKVSKSEKELAHIWSFKDEVTVKEIPNEKKLLIEMKSNNAFLLPWCDGIKNFTLKSVDKKIQSKVAEFGEVFYILHKDNKATLSFLKAINNRCAQLKSYSLNEQFNIFAMVPTGKKSCGPKKL